MQASLPYSLIIYSISYTEGSDTFVHFATFAFFAATIYTATQPSLHFSCIQCIRGCLGHPFGARVRSASSTSSRLVVKLLPQLTKRKRLDPKPPQGRLRNIPRATSRSQAETPRPQAAARSTPKHTSCNQPFAASRRSQHKPSSS